MEFLSTPTCTPPQVHDWGCNMCNPPYHDTFVHVVNYHPNMKIFMGWATPNMLNLCSSTTPMKTPCIMHHTCLHITPSCPTLFKHPTSKPHMVPWLVMSCMWYMNMGVMHLQLMACKEESSSWVIMHAHRSMWGCVGECAMESTKPKSYAPILLCTRNKVQNFMMNMHLAPILCVWGMFALCLVREVWDPHIPETHGSTLRLIFYCCVSQNTDLSTDPGRYASQLFRTGRRTV